MATDIIARGIAANAAANLDAFKAQTAEALAGKADLQDGKVPASQLPSYVDDVTEYASLADFPATGEFGKIYVALDTGYTYRWSGSEYIQIGGQDLSVITANFASLYDDTRTYELGNLCIYEDALYVANDDIDPAEAWDPTHWTRTNVADVISALQAVMEAELATKQDVLVSGENIKTVNGHDITGAGNVEIEANRPIPNSWTVNSTTAALCQSIVNDAAAVKGMTYLGKIMCSDLPAHLVQGEAIISIISSGDANGKDIRITLTSADTVPYHWEYEYVRINGVYGSPAGWVGYQPELVSGTNIKTIEGQSLLGSGNIDLTKADVGLGNVDNTSDADKPVSTAQQAALDGKQDTLVSGTNIKTLEGQSLLGSGNIDLTKSDVGLGNVDNTSDADKPISTAQQAALDLKLNAADYVVDSALSNSSENPVQNKVVKAALDEKVDVDDTTDFEVSEDQVVGAPLLGSIAIDDDPYNIPKKTSDLQNDSDFLQGEDATELEIRRLFRTEYTITGNITNGTMSGDATIWSAETATVTITPDEGYELPNEITVTGATGVYDPATGEVVLSGATGNVSVTVVCVVPTPPSVLAKGDIIHFDALGDGTQKRFRVIDVDSGNIVKLLGLDDLGNSVYNASNRTIAFNNGSGYQNYEGSNLDTYLNTTYYNSLSSAVKSAIVDETLVQSCYSQDTGQSSSAAFNIKRFDNDTVYAYTRTTQRTVGSRHIHVIELDEIKSYFNVSTGDLIQGTAINELFHEQTTAISKYVWCASAYADNPASAFNVLGSGGNLSGSNYNISNVVRPAFKINLSTIEYTKEANA